LVLAFVGGSLGLLWPLVLRDLEPRARWAACVGTALASLNTLAAYALVVWSQRRSTTVFLGAVLGGMVGRMGLMLAAVAAGVLRLGLPKVPLAVSLLAYFVLFLILELTLLHRRTSPQPEVR
jgi:branched-subunit amino acid ABC-type transport system permease component